jgi:hypothetical protein
MAGAWIKLRHDLIDAPEVRRLARATGLDRDQVYGKLFRLWSWADRHGSNGELDAELEDVDDQVGHVGFGAALVSVGWLATQETGIVIPNWERHFSDSAKVRALGANRAEKHRNATSVTRPPAPVTLPPLPEKIREENPPPPPRGAAPGDPAATLRAAWATAAKAGHVQPYRAKDMPKGYADRVAEPGWLDEALMAIDHLARCRYFETPATMIQLCGDGFVTRVLAGQYDEPKPAKATRGPIGAEDRKSAAQAAADWRRGAMDPEAIRRRQEYAEAKARKAATQEVA